MLHINQYNVIFCYNCNKDVGIVDLKFSTHSKLNDSIVKHFIVVKNDLLYNNYILKLNEFKLFRRTPIMQKSENGMNVNTLNHANNDKELVHNEDDQKRKPNFLFSVDYILNKAGNTNTNDVCNNENQNGQHFEWLYCTRFKPPKLDSK